MFRPSVELSHLLEDQEGIVSREQLLAHGVTLGRIRAQLKGGRWTSLNEGVYATFTGDLTYRHKVWAALLNAGDGAIASHETAAYLQSLMAKEPAVVRITVPAKRRVRPCRGVKITRSVRVDEARNWRKVLPQTTVEDTVLDLVDEQTRAEAVVGIVTAACQKRLTSANRLAQAIAKRKRLRSRKLLLELLTVVKEGVESPLEWRYVRDVERPHGLPKGQRQARASHNGRTYLPTSSTRSTRPSWSSMAEPRIPTTKRTATCDATTPSSNATRSPCATGGRTSPDRSATSPARSRTSSDHVVGPEHRSGAGRRAL